jgi:hypothetical protein
VADVREARGILLLHNTVYPSPPDLHESVRAFARHSRFPVYPINAHLGFPPALARMRFETVVLHYTMFYSSFDALSGPFGEFVRDGGGLKVAVFQDEQAYLDRRIEFCRDAAIDCVFTCIERPHSERLYGAAGVERTETYLPGYVSERLVHEAKRLVRPDHDRPIDIGYRGRQAPTSWTGAAREKYEIAVEFERRSLGLPLSLDISTDERKRVYGRRWLRFISRCKGMLGTESGADIHDPNGAGTIPYRTISPRHLEAAALRCCQILYEGNYSGILEPGIHFLALRKDFANFDEVIEEFRSPDRRAELTQNAERDLVASGDLSYRRFVERVDSVLAEGGLDGSAGAARDESVSSALYPPKLQRRARRLRRTARVAARLARSRIRRGPANGSAPQIG